MIQSLFRSRRTFELLSAASLGGAALVDWLFYDRPVGCNVALCATALLLIVCARHPRGISRDIVTRLNQAVNKALEVPDIRDRIVADGFVPTQSTPEDFGTRLARDVARWQEVVKRANIKIDTHG